MKLLLIEPDTVLSRIYVNYFVNNNFQITPCNNSDTVLIELEKEIPDLIILELQIAEHSGIELLHELRSYEDWANIPIIINSLVPRNNIHLNAKIMKQFYIKDYLYKPTTSLEELLASINKVIGDRA